MSAPGRSNDTGNVKASAALRGPFAWGGSSMWTVALLPASVLPDKYKMLDDMLWREEI